MDFDTHKIELFPENNSTDALVNLVLHLEAQKADLQSQLSRKYRHCSSLKRKLAKLTSKNNVSFESHSGDAPPGVSISEGNSSLTQKITAFADEDAGWTTSIGSTYEPTMDLAVNSDGDLGEFLSRPIRARVDSWAVGQPLFYQDDVWKTFCENPQVREKINHYELLRMKLHARLVISGTKFHYGRAIAAYNPLSGFDDVTVSRGTNLLDIDIISLSQKPHVFLNPTKNTGGTLDMPFMWPKNFFSLTDGDYDNMGNLTIKSFGNLLHANEGNDPVTVTLYLWATDVVLTMPTSLSPPVVFESQSGKGRKNQINTRDEYGSGIISKPAAMIEKAAGLLESLPMIRPYALATQMVASKVGQIAKIFGYSRPAILDPPKPFKPNPVGNLANADAPDAVHKLTLDSKAEVTVDSRVVGLDGADQMGITDIACRESFLTAFYMGTADQVDDMLWNVGVSPNLYASFQEEIHPTPMAMLASSFESWQGSVKFRFQIIKSDFHKGKILVRYDPNSNSPEVNYNTNYSRIVDIAEEDDFEVIVGWAQANAWLDCGIMTTVENFSDTVRLPTTTGIRNGVLEINVLNRLVSPAVDSDITLNVYVSMCDDVKFAEPTNVKYQNLHVFPKQAPDPPGPTRERTTSSSKKKLFESQAGTLDQGVAESCTDSPVCADAIQTIGSESTPADNTYLVFYGDPPTTLRELFKRYTFQRFDFPPDIQSGDFRTNVMIRKDLPYQSGWDPDGIDTSEVDGTTQLTHVQKGPIAWFQPCYAAYRGAMRRKYTFQNAADTSPGIGRLPYTTSIGYSQLTGDINEPELLSKQITNSTYQGSMTGLSVTNALINNTIEVELPFYNQQRLGFARFIKAPELSCNCHRVTTNSYETVIPSAGIQANPTLSEFVACGEDFTFYFWTGAPILYRYTMAASD